jgi:hypothetical protein
VDLAELGRVIGKMDAVTASDVQAFANAHWRAGDLRIVVAGDAPQFADGLRKAYPALLVIPQTEVDWTRRGSPRPRRNSAFARPSSRMIVVPRKATAGGRFADGVAAQADRLGRRQRARHARGHAGSW